jgi:anti-anti-sigma factor
MQFVLWLLLPLRLGGVAQRIRRLRSPREQTVTPAPVAPPSSAAKQPEPALRLVVEVCETGRGPVVRLRGEVGVAEAGALTATLLPLIARRPPWVAFDLSELMFISSLGMGVLLAFRRAVVRDGARVCLVPNLRPAVREALERAELLSLFETARGAVPGVGLPGTEGGANRYPNVNDLQRHYGVAWGRLVELEPRLEPLLWRARQVGASCETLTDVKRGFRPLRNELADLIGFAGEHQRHPILGSVGAYEVAYWKLYDAVAGLLSAHAAGAGEAPEM